MIVIVLGSHPNLHLAVTSITCGLEEVLGQQLALFVEIVARSLCANSAGLPEANIFKPYIVHEDMHRFRATQFL
jgi:hypothetical protein